MGDVSHYLGSALVLQRLRGHAQRAGGVDHVVDHDAGLAGDVADDVHHLALVRARAALVDDGEVGVVQTLGQGTRTHHATDVRRHHDDVLVALLPHVAQQHWRGKDVVDGNVEEALDLVSVEVHGEHAVDAGGGDEVRH